MITKLTNANFLLLGLICLAPRTGYELRKILKLTPLGGLSDSPGSIYPTLEKFETRGLVKGARSSSQNGGNKTVYAITKEGLMALREWALRPLTEWEIRQKPDHFIQKFPYLTQMASPSMVAERLYAYEAAVRAEEENLRGIIQRLPPNRVGAGATIELGVELMKVHAKWAKAQSKIYSKKEKQNE